MKDERAKQEKRLSNSQDCSPHSNKMVLASNDLPIRLLF
jgi:hypothetical protein